MSQLGACRSNELYYDECTRCKLLCDYIKFEVAAAVQVDVNNKWCTQAAEVSKATRISCPKTALILLEGSQLGMTGLHLCKQRGLALPVHKIRSRYTKCVRNQFMYHRHQSIGTGRAGLHM